MQKISRIFVCIRNQKHQRFKGLMMFTSKVNGFTDAFDYYEKNAVPNSFKNIKIPTLLINAKNDSFLSESCFPKEEALVNSFYI